jgi:hypothetical protein
MQMKNRTIQMLLEQSELQTQYEGHEEAFQKFVGLIVQECAIELEANRMAIFDANHHHAHWNCGVKWAVAKLQNHITVKMKYIECQDLAA